MTTKKRVHKTYMAIQRFSLTTPIKVNGKIIRINFKGGVRYPKKINGKFGTSDPAIQKALETSKSFNRKWKIIKVIEMNELKPTPGVKEDVFIDNDIYTDVESTETEDFDTGNDDTEEGCEAVNEVTNVSQARKWIQGNIDSSIPFHQLRSREQVISIAKENNIVFPNLPTE